MRGPVRRLGRPFRLRVNARDRRHSSSMCSPPARRCRGRRGYIQVRRRDHGTRSDVLPSQPRRRHRLPRARCRKGPKGRRVRSSSCGAYTPRPSVLQDRRGARRRRAPPGKPARVRRPLSRVGLDSQGMCLRSAPANMPRPPMIGELENRAHPVPTTFSTRERLDIRHRLPDRMVKESGAVTAGTKPVYWGFHAPGRRVPPHSFHTGSRCFIPDRCSAADDSVVGACRPSYGNSRRRRE